MLVYHGLAHIGVWRANEAIESIEEERALSEREHLLLSALLLGPAAAELASKPSGGCAAALARLRLLVHVEHLGRFEDHLGHKLKDARCIEDAVHLGPVVQSAERTREVDLRAWVRLLLAQRFEQFLRNCGDEVERLEPLLESPPRHSIGRALVRGA
eukprot:scaffold36392_cov30-Tisochrysis_lutea.AAC.1